ncbi:chromosome segregation protein SMC [Gemmatimonadota bacterium]
MKLKSLNVHGFKSFADRTEIEFHQGITAIVGPNGCGKSNIGDAIRWVLGEQRPTAIRGAKMEEAIFQGTVNRRPVNRGFVSLTVSNEDGILPVPFEEVELGRVVYRDGGSDYSINRSSCRLRDVLDLCRDTGLGANAYAIIENRMIDAILSDRAEERRGLFEEAAGIGKYKDRRKAALRRLERADLDLQRLDDVIAEVETKVRSLARQKGKAQRYQTLRDRRLAVEVAVVRHQLQTLRDRLEEVKRELAGDRELGEGYVAELQAAETQLETLRLRQAEVERARADTAGRLEEVRSELVRWERDLAVAEERSAYAKRRLVQIDAERGDTVARIQTLQASEEELKASEGALKSEMEALNVEKSAREERVASARGELESAREELQGVQSRLRDLTLRLAQMDGDATSAEAQGTELDRRLQRLSAEIRDASLALSNEESQGDLFAGEVARSLETLESGKESLSAAEDRHGKARGGLEQARLEEAEARETVSSVSARMEALQSLERSQEGLEPTVKAALSLSDPEVFGPLVDSLSGDVEVVRAVEAFLGPLAQGLIVRSASTVARLQSWYGGEWKGRGGLILFPLDRLPPETPVGKGSVLEALTIEGEGAAWARALLAGVSLEVDEEAAKGRRGVDAISLAGTVADRRGFIRLGNPLGSSGILERREQVKHLEEELRGARLREEKARSLREKAEAEARQAQTALDSAWKALRELEDAFRESSAQAEAHSDRRARLDRHQEELARQLEGTRAARDRALERAREARQDRKVLAAEEGTLRKSEEEALGEVTGAQQRWEEARAEESELAVEVAKKDAALTRLLERLRETEASQDEARARVESLDSEKASLNEEEVTVSSLRSEGAKATEELFRLRDGRELELRQREETVGRVNEALQDADRKVRNARSAEREALDRRHRQELEEQELEGRIGRIEERLEGEWGRPLEVLLAEAEPVEGEQEELREELREIVGMLERIGPVNMLAMEEHQEESARLEFLLEQRGDLREARDDLRAAIRQINETATKLFQETFDLIRENFRNTFQRLFEGGEADLWLDEVEDPLESTIEIHASPRGKKTQRIDLLSGGERALTALSLLFGIYLVKPSPFCVMDEVDAPLDESNIYRFIRLLQEFKGQTQFVVITHNARTIEAADWIYGVTMEEPGVSRVVGVRLEDALQESGSAA